MLMCVCRILIKITYLLTYITISRISNKYIFFNQRRRNVQKSGTAHWRIPPLPSPLFLSPSSSPSIFSPFLPPFPLPFSLLEVSFLKLGVWGSAVSSPSGVRGGAPAENEFGAL